MDIIITYVNQQDPHWLKEYFRVVGGEPLAKRFRDWGTLKYLFRGIEVHMPFVRKVFLVVSSQSQVPQWINRDKVNVVLHEDIAPRECLPLFNSSSIEMFLHRIPDLDEKFAYFNDDTFPIKDMCEDDIFCGDKPRCGIIRKYFLLSNSFRHLCKRNSDFARESLGLPPSRFYIRPQHSINPKLRSECELLFEQRKEDILSGITPLRSSQNLNQYAFMDYMFYKGLLSGYRLSNRYLSWGVHPRLLIRCIIRRPSKKLLCINDARMSEKAFLRNRKFILAEFDRLFPSKSSYEL